MLTTYLSPLIKRAYLSIAILLVIYGFYTILEGSLSISIYELLFISPFEIMIILSLAMLSYGLRTIRWITFIKQHQQEYRSPLFHSLVYLSGFAFTITPGKTGELVRGVYLKPLGIPFLYTTACFISERLLDVIVVGLLSTWVLFRLDMIPAALLLISMLPTLLIGMHAIRQLKFINTKTNILRLVNDVFNNLRLNTLLIPFTLTGLTWLSQGMVLVILAQALEINMSTFMLISIYCSGLIIGALSLIPSGIGATELGILFFLTLIGIPEHDALLLSVSSRAFTLLPALILGLCCSLSLTLKREKWHTTSTGSCR